MGELPLSPDIDFSKVLIGVRAIHLQRLFVCRGLDWLRGKPSGFSLVGVSEARVSVTQDIHLT